MEVMAIFRRNWMLGCLYFFSCGWETECFALCELSGSELEEDVSFATTLYELVSCEEMAEESQTGGREGGGNYDG